MQTGGLALLGDWHPGGGNLRLSAGAFLSRYAATAVSQGSVELDGTVYSGRVDARIETERKISPMLTIGYDLPAGRSGWAISTELGAILVGGLTADVSGRASDPALEPAFQADLDAARADIADEIGGISALPFLRIAVGYRF